MYRLDPGKGNITQNNTTLRIIGPHRSGVIIDVENLSEKEIYQKILEYFEDIYSTEDKLTSFFASMVDQVDDESVKPLSIDELRKLCYAELDYFKNIKKQCEELLTEL